MSQANRLPSGGRIDRGQPLTFTFNGRQYQGYRGDTVASALLANGVDVVGRSFKYSRPRGIMAAGPEEPNAILQVGSGEATTTPNLRATETELYDGLVCESTNGWPSVDFDLMGAVGRIGGRFMPPGFYYKTFMYPQSLWMTYEKYIRKGAGLGRAPTEADPDRYDKMNRHCDVLVVGGGPAGLAAALAAGRRGARVILADEQAEPGGHLLASRRRIDGAPAVAWAEQAVAELEAMPEVTILRRSTVFGYHDHNFLTVLERRTDHLGEWADGIRQRVHRVRAGWVVLATGAQERPLVYANNDLPGCMTASAVSAYVNRYGVAPGGRLLLMTTNDHAYRTALDWLDAGREVAAVVDTRPEADGPLPRQARDRGVRVLTGRAVIEARGSGRVRAARIAPIDPAGERVTGAAETVECDLLASSGGWSPVVHLSCHTGGRPVWDDRIVGFVPGEAKQKHLCAGGVQGTYRLGEVLAEGFAAGADAAGRCGFGDRGPDGGTPAADDVDEDRPMALFLVPHTERPTRAPKQFVDFQTDVTAAAIEIAVREGYESIEHVKRYTVMGFGTDQGKLGNVNGVAVTARARGQTIAETGTTVFRPAYTPATFGAIAGSERGHLFDPARFTAMHRWHVEHGAEFENVGQWKRPWYYPKAGESMHDAVSRECLAVRRSLGILDASTLGKIDIQGPDAREFLNRVYSNAWSKLQPGRARYGLMLKDDGMVMDDGVTACIGDDHFVMTTTTGGAAAVLEWLERWHQTEWPELKVYFTSVTDHWATIGLAGPNSRRALQKVCGGVDLAPEAFPFMSFKEGTVAGVPARIFRISFTGELQFEVNVQANYGLYVWERLMEAGAEFDITPYGTETMHVLRAEKGFIIVGQDTDGSVTAEDLGMHWALAGRKPFSYIGRRAMERPHLREEDRKQFVGLKPEDPEAVLPEGAQAVRDPAEQTPMRTIGHVTSSYYSAALGRSFALGLIEGGRERMGERIHFPLRDGRTVAAEICATVFYDPDGERQNV